MASAEDALSATGDRLNLALALCAFAELENACGAENGASAALIHAELLAESLGIELGSELGLALNSCRQLVRRL